MSKTAIVFGVGPLNGLGGQLCLRFASMGLQVLVAGRTQASLDSIVDSIVDAYVYLYNQPRRAWSFEVDVRTSLEKW